MVRIYPHRGKVIKCTECGKKVYRHPSTLNRLRCSKKCANAYIQRTYKADPKRAAHMRRIAKLLPRARTQIHRQRLSVTGKRLVSEGKRSYFVKSGPANPAWKGGVATLQNRLRNTPEYKAWRKAVYERDGYKCRKCGSGKNLHAHHIKEFATHRELRFDVDNGITLCQKHHSELHGRFIPNIGQVNKRRQSHPSI